MDIIRNKNHIKVIGNFKSYYLILVFPYGSEIDPLNFYGLAHMCEHYILQVLEEYIGKKITIYGRTDFDYTICLFRLSNFEDLQKILFGITKKIFLNMNNDTFSDVKTEIITEFLKKSSDKEILFKFISNGYIDHLPIGNKKEMESIVPSILKKHLNKFYKDNSCIYIGDRDIDFKFTGIRIRKKYDDICYQKNQYLNLKNIDSMCNSISIYFINKFKNDIKYFVFGILMTSVITRKLPFEFQVYNKKINGSISLFYLILRDKERVLSDKQVNLILNQIKEYSFSKDDIDIANSIIENALRPFCEKDIYELIETLITEILYDERGIVTLNDIETTIKIIKGISNEDMNDLKNDILKENHSIVYK